MSGTLGSGRGVRLRVDSEGLEFEGIVPAAILAEDQPLSLRGTGGSIDGLTLPFRGVIGAPTGPAPDTRIDIRWDESFARRPIMGLTPIKYDVSRSTGDRLSYVVEYGDGQHTTEPVSAHKSGRAGQLVSRLVVADRFARVNVTTTPLSVASLRQSGGSGWYTSAFVNPVTGQPESRWLLSGDNGIRMSLELGGIEFTGTIVEPGGHYGWRMTLLLRGGSADGQTLTFFFCDGPG